MLITKSEFRDKFGYTDSSSVSHLLGDGSIVATDEGKIDLDHPVNKKFIKQRQKKLKERAKKDAEFEAKQLKLETDLSDQRLLERQYKNTLLELKIAKERGEVIETAVLIKVVNVTFGTLFRQLSEMPLNIVDQIVDYVRVDKEPREKIIKLLVDSITANLQSGLKLAENTAKKYYELDTDKTSTN